MISIKKWNLGQDNSKSSIRGVSPSDDINAHDSNRPLKDLRNNDSRICAAINSTITSNYLYANTIENRTPLNNSIYIDNILVLEKNLYIYGKNAEINVSTLSASDSVITLNKGEFGSIITKGVAGIEVDKDGSALSLSNFLYKEADKYWHFSDSGIATKEFYSDAASTIKTNLPYVNLQKGYPTRVPEEAFVLDANIVSTQGEDIYKNFIRTQTEFNDWFGTNSLIGSGATANGWDYSVIDGAVHVWQKPGYSLLMKAGIYNLTTNVHIAPGLLEGQSKHDCIIKAYDTNIGFYGNSVNNVHWDRFKIFGENINRGEYFIHSLFTLSNVSDCDLKMNVEQVHASYIFNNLGSSTNINYGELIYNNAITFRNTEDGLFDSTYHNNAGLMFESSAGIRMGVFNESVIARADDNIDQNAWDYMVIGETFRIF